MPLKASRRGQVPPFIVMEVMRASAERIAQGKDVIRLELGQPSTGAPSKVVAAAHAALDAEVLGYTLSLGHDRLRRRIAGYYRDHHGISVPEANVVVTTGSSGAFLLGFAAAFEIGDKVGVAAPGYPCYRNILAALGIETVPLPVGPATRFQPDAAMLRRLGTRLDGLIVASPSNPAGTMLPPGELAAIAGWCRAEGVRLISDEIYHRVTYGSEAETAAGTEGVIVVNSFSKYYAMTGWRLGWMIVPDELLQPVERLSQNLFISPPTLSQLAACAAFDCDDELAGNLARYRRNREVLLNELPAAGFERMAPADGAFYLYLDVSRYTNDSEDFCRRMLEEIGVATTPGIDFDEVEGRRALRIGYPGETEGIVEACRRLKAWGK